MAIDFFEKEVERLESRFDKLFGGQVVCDLRVRQAAILSICRAGIITWAIRDSGDAVRTSDLTREFSRIRDVLNRFFDLMESQQERRRYARTGNNERASASG